MRRTQTFLNGQGTVFATTAFMRNQSARIAIFILLSAIFCQLPAYSQDARENTLQIKAFEQDLIWRRFNGIEYPQIAFSKSLQVYSVHSTAYWDKSDLIGTARNRLESFAIKNAVPFKFLASQEERQTMSQQQAENALPYEGDAHFYQSKGTVIFAGGNFTQCLCNAIRATIIHANSSPLNVKIITDATFEIPFPSNLTQKDKSILRPLGEDRNKLSDLISYMDKKDFLEYLRRDWLGSDGLLCPLYDPAFLREPLAKPHGFEIRKNGHKIGQIGAEKQPTVVIDFITMDEMLQNN